MKKKFTLFSICLLPFLSNSQPLSPIITTIPMRDGKSLAADVYLPDTINKYPVILIQTPYNRIYYRWNLPLGVKTNLASCKYAFVILDWRCFYGSTSACVTSPDRGKDGYDAVQWIASQKWSDGKVGTWGPSALGGVQYQTAKEKPANLVCAVPQVAGSQFDYLSYFPGGVYRTEYVQQLDALGYGMSTTLLANPVYNATWQYIENINMYPELISVPMFLIGGWYDHNVNEMLVLFDSLKMKSAAPVKDKHKILMGPWVHGGSGSAYVGSAQQGELSYPGAAGWSDSLAMRFFDYHLRGISNGWDAEPVIRYFQMGEDKWNSSSNWPPAVLPDIKLYLGTGGSLNPVPPSAAKDSSVITYDPRDPSPTIGGPTLKAGLKQGPFDQADSVENRNDILIYTTPVLTQDVKLKGTVTAVLYVTSDRLDTDFAIRLTDVYPNGKSILVADGIRRLRFRNGYTAADTSVITPGQIYQLSISLPHTAITFLAGHRIRVDITSSNYPRFDKNLNNGQTMYTAGDTLVAANTIYHNSTKASYVSFAFESYPGGVQEIAGELLQLRIHPNPAKESAVISFKLTEKQNIKLELYDLSGKKVITFFNGILNADSYSFYTELSGVSEGIYVLQLSGAHFLENKKMVITR